MTRFNPTHWPACSACNAAYVVRRSFIFNMKKGTTSERWIWQRDCRHKKAEAEIVSRPIGGKRKRQPSAVAP